MTTARARARGHCSEAAPAPRGVSARLAPGDDGAAEALLADCSARGLERIRLLLPLAEWRDGAASDWYRRFVARAARRVAVTVAACRAPRPDTPLAPVGARDDGGGYEGLVAGIGQALGDDCEWLELADPLGPVAWPDRSAASAELLRALVARLDARAALGGLPLDRAWLGAAREAGVLEPFGALAFPDPAAVTEAGEAFGPALAGAQAIAGRRSLWLAPERLPAATADGGLATAAEWAEAEAPARLFLPCAGAPGAPGAAGPGVAARFALVERLLERGGGSLRAVAGLGAGVAPAAGYDLVTGGAGFVGSNLALRLARAGRSVVVLDNLSRPGTEENLDWLCRRAPERIHPAIADIRDREAVQRAAAGAERVFHLAAQVAVTTSLADPHADHEVNAAGTLNVLDALRRRDPPPPLILTSTNKVYGTLGQVSLRRTPAGYEPIDAATGPRGIGEQAALALSSPYGCSKGAADQYVLDHADTFGLPAIVFRMSCIYGPRQFGTEDQGWVAHFVRQLVRDEPITIYGDGHQVRDLLYVDDLVDALVTGMERMPELSGQAFNIGGGAGRAVSLLGLLDCLERLHGAVPPIRWEDWRAGDQRYYVSAIDRFHRLTGWSPRVDLEQGIRYLYDWMRAREAGEGTTPATGPDRRMAL